MMPRTIVVPVDGSPAALAALGVAVQLAKGAGAQLTVIHASPRLAESVFEENPLTRVEQEEVAADPVLAAAVAQAAEAGVEAHVRLVGEGGVDGIADAVLGIAASVEADLIVMGSRGRGGIAESLLGSVSRSVAMRSPVRVVVVHEPVAR